MTGGAALRNLTATYMEHRHAVLFYSLLVTLIASPLLAILKLGDQWLQFFLAVNLLVAVFANGVTKRKLLLTVVAAIVLGRLIAISFDATTVSAGLLALWIIIGLKAAYDMLCYALRSSSVNSEHIYGALSAYLLAGLFWGALYWVLEHCLAGSIASPAATGEFTPFHAVYFSFVTLATLGYGDIVPKSDLARGLVIVEALAGQLYLAVTISRLISLYIRSATKDEA